MHASIIRLCFLAACTFFALVLTACSGAAVNAPPAYDAGSDTTAASVASPTTVPGVGGATSPGADSGDDYAAPAAPPTGSGPRAPAAPSDGRAADAASTPPASNPDAQRYAIVPDESRATYHARQQVFAPGIGAGVDGSTTGVTGAIFFDAQHPARSQIGTITVPVDQLTSGIDARDQQLRGAYLESSTFPTATFTATGLENLPDTAYTDGEELHFKIAGDLTVHDVTRPVVFDATARITGDMLTGSATTTIMMSDFGIEVPDLANFVKAEDAVGLELSITAQRD
jgi:polyisoprenoid-binding protein YceI